MSGNNVASDYVESLNDNYSDVASVCSGNSEVSNSAFTDFAFLLSQQHFFIRSETLRVFMSLLLAHYIVSWYGVDDVYSLILNNMVHLICIENGYDLSASSFSWVIFSDDSLVDLNFNTVVKAYGFDPFHEDFLLKTFLEQEIIFLDTSNGPDHSPDFPNEPGYQEWVNSPNLNLSPIEVEFLNFLKGYSSDDSDDSMVVDSDEISCKYFDGQSVYFSFYIKKASLVPDDPNNQVQEVSTVDTITPTNGKFLDFSYLDNHKCRFCKRYICDCWNSFSSIDDVDSDFDYSSD
ncbi:hypothetical protein F8M41_002352 [Gigaspora margarita]|uniref:Uncharacterized protein n=1 Tax=Gigaspora margarita TaxID=4874 RepID=A0A8H4B543_GIGMA|nr:hypothetical protein F8M41_002352 [Gigaspora margarita]